MNKNLHMVTWILLIVGGLNWLLVGLFMWDISAIFGGMSSWISRLIYILVGASAIYELMCHKSCCKVCDSGMKPMGGAPSMPGMSGMQK